MGRQPGLSRVAVRGFGQERVDRLGGVRAAQLLLTYRFGTANSLSPARDTSIGYDSSDQDLVEFAARELKKLTGV